MRLLINRAYPDNNKTCNHYWVALKGSICCDQVQLEFEPWTDEARNGEIYFQIKVSHNRKDLVGWLLSFNSNQNTKTGPNQSTAGLFWKNFDWKPLFYAAIAIVKHVQGLLQHDKRYYIELHSIPIWTMDIIL